MKKRIMFYDVETYRNYFLCYVWDRDNDVFYRWERRNDIEVGRPREELLRMMYGNVFVGFNNHGYDDHIVEGYLNGFTNEKLYEMSQYLINGPDGNLAPWRVADEFGYESIGMLGTGDIYTIDVMPVCPLRASLKMYAGRNNYHKLQDLPIHWERFISEADTWTMYPYCQNDCGMTADLFEKVRPQLRLRQDMEKLYPDIGLVSRSDPSIAENVIKDQLKRRGVDVWTKYQPKESYTYEPPEYLSFETPEMQEKLRIVKSCKFNVGGDGKLIIPDELADAFDLFGKKYQMGNGGLHSCEKKRTLYAGSKDPAYEMCDADVASYYPSMIINLRYFPELLGEDFLEVYEKIYWDRLNAKRSGDKVTANSLKIVLNSSFGKFGNKHSCLFSPKLLIQTTMSGQLLLLKLIEMFELRGIEVVSGNTDGVVSRYRVEDRPKWQEAFDEWQKLTNMELERVDYCAIHNQSVNDYLAISDVIDDNGPTGEFTVKGKATFKDSALDKNPKGPVMRQAMINQLTGVKSIEDTIRECTDIRQFCFLQKVGGGAEWRMHALGSTVRWYNSTDGDSIHYLNNGNKVGMSDFARPCNDLPDQFPDDVNYQWYIDRCGWYMKRMGL